MKRLILFTLGILTLGLLPLLLNGMHGVFQSDFISQQIPFMIETKRVFSTLSPFWSWNTHIGENFLATYSFYTITSPFVWLVSLFPTQYILWGILLSLYLKTTFTAIFCYLYFKKMNIEDRPACIGALLYTFSSFYICNLYYFHFCEPIMVFPLLLICIENFIAGKRQRVFWLAACTFLVVFINYYFATCSLILGALYYVYRALGAKQFNLSNLLKAIMAVLLGILAASAILLPTILNIVGAPRASTSLQTHYYGIIDTCIRTLQRLFYLLFPSVAESGESLYESGFTSNQAYVGVFGIMPAIWYLIKKRNWAGKLFITLLVCYFIPPLNGVFSMFSNYEYTRWLYGLILIAILCSLKLFSDGGRIKPIFMTGYVSFAAIILLISIAYRLYINPNHELGMTVKMLYEFILIGINAACLAVWAGSRYNMRVLLWCVSIAGCANMTLFVSTQIAEWRIISTDANMHRDPIYKYILNQPQEISNSGDYSYRSDFISKYCNNAMILNRPAIKSFHSLFNKNVVELRAVIDNNIGSPVFSLDKHRTELATLLSLKEVLVYDSIGGNTPDPNYSGVPRLEGLIPKNTYDNIRVYDFAYYIPIGFSYDHYITYSELKPAIADSLNIPLLMLDNLVIDEEDEAELSKYLRHGILNEKAKLDSLAKARRRLTSKNFAGNSKGLRCNIDMPRAEVVFFSVPCDEGFTAKIDGTPTKIYRVNLGLSAIIVPAGRHNVEFSYYPPGMTLGIALSLLSFIILLTIYLHQRKTSYKINKMKVSK